jgi:predicted ATP-dependent protease
VIVPESNVRNLMLSREVVEAVAAGHFHVWSATTVDQGIELLTGMPAGGRGDDGRFPEGTIHARVEERLERWGKLDEGPETPTMSDPAPDRPRA